LNAYRSIQLDGTLKVRGYQRTEIVGQLRWAKTVDLVGKVFAHTPDATNLSAYSLGLQAFELEVL
jgi:hypothetical protein